MPIAKAAAKAVKSAAKAYKPKQKYPVVTRNGHPHYRKPNGKLVDAVRSDARISGRSKLASSKPIKVSTKITSTNRTGSGTLRAKALRDRKKATGLKNR